MIAGLDAVRLLLEEISPEQGVTDLISETYMQVRKQQLELDREQQPGSK